ncbi:SCP2 sterol-binding domain-containing protein [Candidatus Harpocratesius sp.]
MNETVESEVYKEKSEKAETFLEILDRNRLKFIDPKVKKAFNTWNKVVQYYFTDTGEYWHFKLEKGIPGPLIQSKIEKPDILYEMSKDTFLAIDKKEISGMKAYSQKLVKVKAKMPDLLKLQKLDKV